MQSGWVYFKEEGVSLVQEGIQGPHKAVVRIQGSIPFPLKSLDPRRIAIVKDRSDIKVILIISNSDLSFFGGIPAFNGYLHGKS